jgi:hypothetical protein
MDQFIGKHVVIMCIGNQQLLIGKLDNYHCTDNGTVMHVLLDQQETSGSGYYRMLINFNHVISITQVTPL